MLKYLRIFTPLVILSNLSDAAVSEWKKDDDVLNICGSEIHGFKISHFGENYQPNTDFTGILFYDIGRCSKVARACKQMKSGYALFQKDKEMIERRDSKGLRSIGEAMLDGFFVNKPPSFLVRLVVRYDVKMVMFSVRNGVLSTQLSTKVIRDEVDESPDMNAYEYAMLDALNDQWQKKGVRATIMVPDMHKVIEERLPETLESVVGLDKATEFKNEYVSGSNHEDKSEEDMRADYYGDNDSDDENNSEDENNTNPTITQRGACKKITDANGRGIQVKTWEHGSDIVSAVHRNFDIWLSDETADKLRAMAMKSSYNEWDKLEFDSGSITYEKKRMSYILHEVCGVDKSFKMPCKKVTDANGKGMLVYTYDTDSEVVTKFFQEFGVWLSDEEASKLKKTASATKYNEWGSIETDAQGSIKFEKKHGFFYVHEVCDSLVIFM